MAIDSTIQEAGEIAAEKRPDTGLPPVFKDPGSESNGNNGNGKAHHPLNNRILAMALFIGADIMFFAGLIGSFMVFRFGSADWPPVGQPLLPLGVTGLNTAVLLFSGFTMVKTWRLLGNWKRNKIRKWLNITTLFGIIFLLIQGFEWFRLLGFGLKLSSGVYGATFYTIIGCHALHVLGAVIWLSIVTVRWQINPNLYNSQSHAGIKIAGMYWVLVVALWPVLYGLVYFS